MLQGYHRAFLSELFTPQIIKTMTDEFENELDDSYQLNVAFSKKLAGKVNNLREYT